jgi:D-ornithine 4,5-aminomutase subunit alpha
MEPDEAVSNAPFDQRRAHLRTLSDAELRARFWQLAEQAVNPLVELARTHTTPSIERSVLLRGGLSSIEAGLAVQGAVQRGLLGLGAGNLVLRLAKKRGVSFVEAGRILAAGQGWEEVGDGA